MQYCTICKKSEKETIFGKDKRCLSCNRKRRIKFYKKNQIKEKEKSLAKYHLNRDAILARNKNYYKQIKEKVFEYYGGYKCNCCGENGKEFLTIDHIDGGGNTHRKSMGGRGTYIYNWIIKNNFPPMFQILCYNCNLAKAKNNNICPHKKEKKLA